MRIAGFPFLGAPPPWPGWFLLLVNVYEEENLRLLRVRGHLLQRPLVLMGEALPLGSSYLAPGNLFLSLKLHPFIPGRE